MMGTQSAPAQKFYDFDLEHHVPSGRMLRETDRFLDVDGMRESPSFCVHDKRPVLGVGLLHSSGIARTRWLRDNFCFLSIRGDPIIDSLGAQRVSRLR